jgi:hypothetical protein
MFWRDRRLRPLEQRARLVVSSKHKGGVHFSDDRLYLPFVSISETS